MSREDSPATRKAKAEHARKTVAGPRLYDALKPVAELVRKHMEWLKKTGHDTRTVDVGWIEWDQAESILAVIDSIDKHDELLAEYRKNPNRPKARS